MRRFSLGILLAIIAMPAVSSAAVQQSSWGRIKATMGLPMEAEMALSNVTTDDADDALDGIYRRTGVQFQSGVHLKNVAAGYIVIDGYDQSGEEHAFVLGPDGRIRYHITEDNKTTTSDRAWNTACGALGGQVMAKCLAGTVPGWGTLGCVALGVSITVLCQEMPHIMEAAVADSTDFIYRNPCHYCQGPVPPPGGGN